MTATPARDQSFRIQEFINPATQTRSWRVTGHLRGKRYRENFATKLRAEERRLELEVERLGQQTAEAMRATWLTADQLRMAESIFNHHPASEVQLALSWWERSGREQDAATKAGQDLTLDEAAAKFATWLEATPAVREATRRNLGYRVAMFVSESGNVPLATITPEFIEAWLDRRKVCPTTKDNDRRALGRFFGWCTERKQRYLTNNPAAAVKVELPEAGVPEVYTLRDTMRILAAARRFRGGRFLKTIVLQLFGGMRPTEALRFGDDQLVDGAITVSSTQSKVGRSRTIVADPVLLGWLELCPNGPVSDPQKSKLLWGQLKVKMRLKSWIHDGLRHTALSHFFRRSGSYGLTAEWAGNSEAVIKTHYQGRVSAAETARFWALFPDRKDRKKPTATKTKKGAKT